MDQTGLNKGLLTATAFTLLGGCAAIPKDLGRSEVDALVEARGIALPAADAAVAELTRSLLAEPLNAERAVRLALLNNPGIKQSYARLGFGAAELYEAGRISNPVFEASVLDPDVSGEKDLLTFGLAISFTDLLTLPARSRLAKADFAALQQEVGAEVFTVATEAERHYYRFVAAKQIAAMRAQIATAGELSAELAQRFLDAGNISARELALEKAAASEARLAALDSESEAYAARTALADQLGLSVSGDWDAPAELRSPPADDGSLTELLTLARDSRLDLAAARARADVIADRLGVSRWTRWLGDLNIGVERERETDGTELTGPTLEWEPPLFNQHRDELLRLDAELTIALVEVEKTQLMVDNAVRQAYAALGTLRAQLEEYRQTLLPQRMASTERAQEEMNYMLIGVFELLGIKREEYDAYQSYLETVRDYWLARTELAQAVGAALPGEPGGDTLGVDDLLRQPPGVDHDQHDMDHSSHSEKTQDDAHDQHDHGSHGGAT